MKNRKPFSLILYVIVMGLLMSWAVGLFDARGNDIPYSQVVEMFRQEQVKSFTVQKNTIYMTLHTPFEGDTLNEGVFSLWKGHRPI